MNKAQKIVSGCTQKIFGDEKPILPTDVDAAEKQVIKKKQVIGMHQSGYSLDKITRYYAVLNEFRDERQLLVYAREKENIRKIIAEYEQSKQTTKAATS